MNRQKVSFLVNAVILLIGFALNMFSLCFHNSFPNVISFFRVILLYGEHALTPTACFLLTFLLPTSSRHQLERKGRNWKILILWVTMNPFVIWKRKEKKNAWNPICKCGFDSLYCNYDGFRCISYLYLEYQRFLLRKFSIPTQTFPLLSNLERSPLFSTSAPFYPLFWKLIIEQEWKLSVFTTQPIAHATLLKLTPPPPPRKEGFELCKRNLLFRMSMKEDVDNIDNEADEEIDGKRGITYQVKSHKFTP